MKKVIWILAAIAALVCIVYFNVRHDENLKSNGPFRIGAALPLTGAVASFGEEFQRGAEIAEDEINSSKPEVKVVFEDTALDPSKAVDAVTKLVNINQIQALFVSAYSEAAATHQIADAKGIPTLVLWDSNPQLEDMGDKVFAIGPWTPASGEVTAEFAYSKGAKKAAIFGYVQEWSKSVSENFKNKFASLGGSVTSEDFSNPGATDYRTILTKILSTHPDVVYMTTEDFLRGVEQIKQLGYKGMIITSDLLDNTQIQQNPGLFEGVYGSQVADPEMAETNHYIDLYKKKFGEDPKKILYGAWGYDAVKLLYKAHTGASNGSIINNLYKTDYAGASGNIKFNDKGSSKTMPKMFVVKDGIIIKAE